MLLSVPARYVSPRHRGPAWAEGEVMPTRRDVLAAILTATFAMPATAAEPKNPLD